MLKSTVYSLGSPGTFDITDKDDPMYYVARFAHEQSQNLYNLQQAGFEWRQGTQTDFGSIETEFDTFLTAVAAWFETAVAASMAGSSIPALPTMPNLHPTYEASDGGVSVWWLVIKFLLWYVLLRFRKSLEDDTDTEEIVNILRRIFMRKNEAEEEYSLVELLANQPLEIILSKVSDFQDLVYSDRPIE